MVSEFNTWRPLDVFQVYYPRKCTFKKHPSKHFRAVKIDPKIPYKRVILQRVTFIWEENNKREPQRLIDSSVEKVGARLLSRL